MAPSVGWLAPCVCIKSCVTCRTRKVRCDKTSPCSNCRRANIACVFPPLDRPPRWARRLERIANNAKAAQEDADPGVNQVMERLRSLEGLVKELSGQLEQAHAAVASAGSTVSTGNSPGSMSNHDQVDASNMHKQFGRLVLGDSKSSCYVSSGFWTRVNDELDDLKAKTEGLTGADFDDSSGDEDSPGKTPSSTQELDRTPLQRHAFLFGHNIGSPTDLREFQPLPSQIPFLVNIFHENINCMIQVVHLPSVNRMMRDLRGGDMSSLSPTNAALMFAIYYAAIASMEEDDIMTNFGSPMSELNMKYRLGLEHALGRADFLNSPDIVLVQAFSIFLTLARRSDSPKFIWMLTGLVIRMAQSLGLQRDGSHFPNLSPFEVEMRRRVWWIVCSLDLRSSEDMGTDLTISQGSFDTRLPLNINDGDMDADTRETPQERAGLCDMTFALVNCGMVDVMRQIATIKDGNVDDQNRLVNELYGNLERRYLQYTNASDNVAYWVSVTITRLVMAKMTLFIYMPALVSSSSEHFSDETRTKLFVAAIEVAEYNHALNAEQTCRHWRWIFQTYTHWHAIVYILMAAAQRPWSPMVERAWVALHSPWLIPAQDATKNAQNKIWLPLRKLMAQARRHRDAELERLRRDPRAAQWLDEEDRRMPQPASSDSAEYFRERWHQLLALSTSRETPTTVLTPPSAATASPRNHGSVSPYGPGSQSGSQSGPGPGPRVAVSQPVYIQRDGLPRQNSRATMAQFPTRNVHVPDLGQGMPPNPTSHPHTHTQTHTHGRIPFSHPSAAPSYGYFPSVPADVGDGPSPQPGPGFGPWLLWADSDPSVDVFADVDMGPVDFNNMDLEHDVDWNNWFETARGMELMGEPPSGSWA